MILIYIIENLQINGSRRIDFGYNQRRIILFIKERTPCCIPKKHLAVHKRLNNIENLFTVAGALEVLGNGLL